ncbi:MAG: aminopeptidase P family protein [Planctomycetes bacterium]|nr:aminopeptidase P family protein [Planctomycetota bacterium]
MPSPSHHKSRRKQFLESIDSPVLLMAGGWISRNYPANWSPFRADSTFLCFFPNPEPNAAALFDPKDKSVTLFLDERTADDALWHGPSASFAEVKRELGVTRVEKRSDLAAVVKKQVGNRKARTLAIPDPRATAEARKVTGDKVDFYNARKIGDPALLLAIAELRNHRAPEEVKEMRLAAAVTRDAHKAAMAHTRPGVYEQELVGHVEGTFVKHGCVPAYGTILSVRGEVLHNHDHGNLMKSGDLVLLDAGAELPSGYCGDVTRTWPVNGRFSPEQRDVYDIVLEAEKTAIAMVKPGARYRDLHLASARVLADGLGQLGLMRGAADDLVASGAHAVFFPHGVGHLIGLDVHDMEGFGDLITYPPGRKRSTQFGTAFLRLDVDLEPGMCVTIEPGIYFVPALLRDPQMKKRFKDQIDFAKAQRFLDMNSKRGFGGVRIEDDVMCTKSGHDVLSAEVPKERLALEALVGSAC